MSEETKKEEVKTTPIKRETVEVDKQAFAEIMKRVESMEKGMAKITSEETYDPYADRVEADDVKLVAIEGKDGEQIIVTGVKSGGKAFKKETEGGQLHNGLMTKILVRNSKGEEIEMDYDYNELTSTGITIQCKVKETKSEKIIKDLGWLTSRSYVPSNKLDGALVSQDGEQVRNVIVSYKTKYIVTLPSGEDIEVYESAINIKY